MNKSLRSLLNLIGLILGGSIFLYQAYVVYQTTKEKGGLHIASPFFLLAAGSLAILVIGLQMFAWSQLMRGLGRQLPWLQICKGYSLSFLPRYIPGSVWGYLSRNEWLRHSYGIEYNVSNLGSLLEMLSILLASVLILGTYLVLNSTGFIKNILVVGLVGCPVVIGWVIKIIPRSLFNWRPIVQFLAPLKAMNLSLLNWYGILALYFLFWLSHGGIVFFVIAALGFQSTGGIAALSAMFSLAWLIGFFSIFVPSGLGVREIALADLLVISTGLFAGQAAAVALLSRMIALFGELLWLLIGVSIQFLGSRRQVVFIGKDNP